MKSVSIIGANSYIARNLTYIISREHPDTEMFLYDREEGHKDGMDGYSRIDILDVSSVEDINYDVDAVIVFAGKTGTYAGFDDCKTFIDVNETGLLSVLNAMRKAKSRAKVVFPSTRLVYRGKDEPLKEDDEKEFKTVYAINKFACEQYLKMYSSVFGIRYAIFRICVPYGTLLAGAGSYGTAEIFLTKAKEGKNITLYGRGEVKRTLTYIGDLCRILYAGAESELCEGDAYNIGGEEYSLYDMASALSGLYGVGVDFIPWPDEALRIESGSTVFDSTKLDSLIGKRYNMTFGEWIGGHID